MHENRETSGTSRPNHGRDRPEKAVSRTAGRHVPEESERVTVPVNRSNKEGAILGGDGGGKDADQGEHRSIQHEPDAERGTSVTGIARCA
jgi:hypothetical protein